MANALDIVTTAQKQVGFYGGTTDANPYGEWYGIPDEPWCAMFVSWVFAQNNLSNLVAAQTTKGFSYCPAGLAWFQQKKAVVDKYSGQPGDIVFFSWEGNGIADHVEIVVAASKDGITTIGGNTGPEHMTDASQYDGHGVYLRHRAYLYVLAVVRPAYENPVKPTTSLGTNKTVAAGVAGATAIAGGGVAATHNSTPTPAKSTTVFTAPPWAVSDFPLKGKTPEELAVEQALYKAGLLAGAGQNSAWSNSDVAAVKAFQKMQGAPQTGIVDKSTYDSLMKKLP
jgi:CHAP domain/Putative peptidoglycan binding domain